MDSSGSQIPKCAFTHGHSSFTTGPYIGSRLSLRTRVGLGGNRTHHWSRTSVSPETKSRHIPTCRASGTSILPHRGCPICIFLTCVVFASHRSHRIVSGRARIASHRAALASHRIGPRSHRIGPRSHRIASDRARIAAPRAALASPCFHRRVPGRAGIAVPLAAPASPCL